MTEPHNNPHEKLCEMLVSNETDVTTQFKRKSIEDTAINTMDTLLPVDVTDETFVPVAILAFQTILNKTSYDTSIVKADNPCASKLEEWVDTIDEYHDFLREKDDLLTALTEGFLALAKSEYYMAREYFNEAKCSKNIKIADVAINYIKLVENFGSNIHFKAAQKSDNIKQKISHIGTAYRLTREKTDDNITSLIAEESQCIFESVLSLCKNDKDHVLEENFIPITILAFKATLDETPFQTSMVKENNLSAKQLQSWSNSLTDYYDSRNVNDNSLLALTKGFIALAKSKHSLAIEHFKKAKSSDNNDISYEATTYIDLSYESGFRSNLKAAEQSSDISVRSSHLSEAFKLISGYIDFSPRSNYMITEKSLCLFKLMETLCEEDRYNDATKLATSNDLKFLLKCYNFRNFKSAKENISNANNNSTSLQGIELLEEESFILQEEDKLISEEFQTITSEFNKLGDPLIREECTAILYNSANRFIALQKTCVATEILEYLMKNSEDALLDKYINYSLAVIKTYTGDIETSSSILNKLAKKNIPTRLKPLVQFYVAYISHADYMFSKGTPSLKRQALKNYEGLLLKETEISSSNALKKQLSELSTILITHLNDDIISVIVPTILPSFVPQK